MSQENTVPQDPGGGTAAGMPVWTRAWLVLAAAFVSLGFALRQFESAGGEAPSVEPVPATAGRVAPEQDPIALDARLDSPSTFRTSDKLDPDAAAALSEFAAPDALVPRQHTSPALDSTPGALELQAPPGEVPTANLPPTNRSGEDPSVPWSPLFLKGGLSLFVGLCVGYALRAFLKLTLVALGLVFMVMLGLQYTGLLEVDWSAAGGLYETVATRVAGELDSLRAFVAGSLPSAGLGSIGLLAGLKRSA